MKVYLLYKGYCNGVESWHHLRAIYKDKTTAELFALEKNELLAGTNTEYCEEEWFVTEMEVL